MSVKKNILVVDDDPDFIEMNKLVLEKKGYEVTVANSGQESLGKIQAKKTDLIILDVMMASLDEGFEVSRDLRNSEQTKNIPILMVTSINDTVPFKFEPDETWLPVDDFLLFGKPLLSCSPIGRRVFSGSTDTCRGSL